MDLQLQDKNVVVTGGASNIGRGIVHAFAEEGARLFLLDIDEAKGTQTCAEACDKGASSCTFVRADLSDPEGCTISIGQIVDDLEGEGGIDALINNFGWGDPGLLLATVPEQWDRLWRMNLGATIGCSQAALGDMKKRQKGAIVSIASDAAQGVPNQSVYGAMKGGVITFTKSVAQEFGRYNIRANVISPGVVFPESGDAGERSVWNRGEVVLSEKQINETHKLQSLRRATRPADIANAALYFASEVSGRQVTGQHLSVSGGWWMP